MLRGDQCSLFKKPRNCADGEGEQCSLCGNLRNCADAER